MTVRILIGDSRARLAEIAPGSVHACITSPPYFGLRDYGADGQIGLEATPDEYVAELVNVFRGVRRALRDDGTLWLNLGDSYCSTDKWGGGGNVGKNTIADDGTVPSWAGRKKRAPIEGVKPKDLIGIPWMVAKALRAPFYTGRIASEADRAYLAGFLDGEGTISFVERDRGPDHTPTHDVRVFLTNTDDSVLRHFCSLTAGRVYQHDGERENRFGSRPCFRWQMGTHDGSLLIRELFPYLRTKRKQAALVWTLYGTLRHRNGHARTPASVVEQRRAIADMVRALNRGEAVDLPGWVEEPPSCHEPGWYLRQWLPWVKRNPMPESTRDRPTSACEIVFMLTKKADYFFDYEEVRRGMAPASHARFAQDVEAQAGSARAAGGQKSNGTMKAVRGDKQRGHSRRHVGFNERWDHMEREEQRSVRAFRNSDLFYDSLSAPHGAIVGEEIIALDVATQPFSEAHFAVMPPRLVEPLIRASVPVGGTVLDPFGGAGTTALVADRMQRNAIMVELNSAYADMARKRIDADNSMFSTVEVAA